MTIWSAITKFGWYTAFEMTWRIQYIIAVIIDWIKKWISLFYFICVSQFIDRVDIIIDSAYIFIPRDFRVFILILKKVTNLLILIIIHKLDR